MACNCAIALLLFMHFVSLITGLQVSSDLYSHNEIQYCVKIVSISTSQLLFKCLT